MACFHVWCGFDGRYCGQCTPPPRVVMQHKTCADFVREVRDYNFIRADEKHLVGESNRDEMLIVGVLDRILAASSSQEQRGMEVKCVAAITALMENIEFSAYDSTFPNALRFLFQHDTKRVVAANAIDDAFAAIERANDLAVLNAPTGAVEKGEAK